MVVNRRGLALSAVSAAVVMVLSATLGAQKNDKKQSDAQKKETLEVIKIADAAMAGQPMTDDLGLTWAHEDYLKATNQKEYIPFTITFDTSKVTPGATLALYWRVVAKDAGAGATPPGKKDDKKDKDKNKQAGKYAYEDINFIPANAGMGRISRSFTVPAGMYDVYVVMKEPAASQKNAPAPKVATIKQSVTVPDFWAPELTTSSVIVASKIEPLNAPLSPNEQAERPYALGAMEIVPAIEPKFSTKGELSIFMLIYNPQTDEMHKPDVTVEYNFYSKPAGAAEKFFNKTSPQDLNAKTLPPAFDMSLGHQLQTGQAVPLTSFPAGDYRLEIKVTDKLAMKTITRDVNFTVTAS